jgi:LmbE family N-acetylglucosaminyl deacetylase
MSATVNIISTTSEGWQRSKKILIILAHPDDPEFFCGATIARWCALGHHVSYCLLTSGQRGTQDSAANPQKIAKLRKREQIAAANVLGVNDVKFLEYMDGELVPDIHLRNKLVSEIRNNKPDIIVSCDPTNIFPADNRINHPDHRAAGQAVLDATFPAAGNPGYRLEVDGKELPAHNVQEVWLSLTNSPNYAFDVTNTLETKIDALLCHKSQMKYSREELQQNYLSRFEVDPLQGKRAYFEKFRRIIFFQ